MCVTTRPGMLRQKRQKLEFLRRQLELGILRGSARWRTASTSSVADLQERDFCLPLHPVPQRGAHPRHQFADIEGLVDIVVGAEIERLDLFGLPLTRRQYDNW